MTDETTAQPGTETAAPQALATPSRRDAGAGRQPQS